MELNIKLDEEQLSVLIDILSKYDKQVTKLRKRVAALEKEHNSQKLID